ALPPPGAHAVGEATDHSVLLRVHAEDRQPLRPELLDHRLEVAELPVPVRVVRPGEALDVDVQVVVQVPEQVRHGPRGRGVAEPGQVVAERLQAAADVLGGAQGVAPGDRLDQPRQGLDELGIFFFSGGRPPPRVPLPSPPPPPPPPPRPPPPPP